MKTAVFNTKPYEREFLSEANREHGHELVWFEPVLNEKTVSLAEGFPAVCVFVNDDCNRKVLAHLAGYGTRLVALRAAGFNNIDIDAAQEFGLTVLRVPDYSPHAVAEHTFGLILALNRKLHRSHARVREQNFALQGLMGFDLHGRTLGIVGAGKIGARVAAIATGFGLRVLAHDPAPNRACEKQGVRYAALNELAEQADILSLHCPLTPGTHHMIDRELLGCMRPGGMLINTSRGGLIDTRAVIAALKSEQLGNLGIDVYEEESNLFFKDLSETVIQDDVFARLLTFPNVLITAHQGFFTQDALTGIAETTLRNITGFERNAVCEENRVGKKHLQ